MELFSIFARIGLDTSDFDRGISDAEEKGIGFVQTMTDVSSNLSKSLARIGGYNEVSMNITAAHEDIVVTGREAEGAITSLRNSMKISGEVWGGLTDSLTDFRIAGENALNTIFDIVNAPMTDAISNAGEKISGLTNRIREDGDLYPTVQRIGEAISRIVEAVVNFAANVIPTILKVLSPLTTALANLFELASKIYPAIIGIATAFGAWKIGLPVYNLITGINKKIAAFMKVTAGATKAMALKTLAWGALKKAMAASGIGLVIIAVGALVAGIATLVRRIGGLSEETEALRAENDKLMYGVEKLTDRIRDNAAAHQENMKGIEAESKETQDLLARINELNEVEEKTLEQRQEMAQAVRRLSNIMPELALRYDAETGAINMSVDALNRQVEAREAQQRYAAKREREVKAAEQVRDAELKLAAVREQQSEALRVYGSDLTVFGNTRKENREEVYRLAEAEQDLIATIGESRQYHYDLRAEIYEAGAAYRDAIGAVEEYAQTQADLAAEVAAAAAEKARVTEEMAAMQKETLRRLAGEYRRVSGKTTDAFRDMNTGVSRSLEEMRDTLIRNAEATRDWGSNISTIMDEAMRRGVDEGVLAKLEEMMNRGPGYAQMMADDLEFVFGELAPAMEDAARSVIDKITTVFGTDTSVAYSVKKLMRDTGKTLEEAVEAMGLEEVGADVVRSLVLGIKSEARQAALAADHVANLTAASMREAFEMRSPSRVFMDIGRDTVKGLAKAA